MQYLETLDISLTRIDKLPSTITKLQRLARLYLSRRTIIPVGTIGRMRSLEELFFVISKGERGECLKELGQLNKLRTVMLTCTLDWFDESDEDLQNNLGALISSCNLHTLYVIMIGEPAFLGVSLESWCPTAPCRLQKLCLMHCYIDKVPSWMSLLVNLRELALNIIKMTPEGVAILGAIPTLVFLKVTTLSGTNGKIFIHGFRILKYLYLKISSCRTSPEFEAGSMPKLEHLSWIFPCIRWNAGILSASSTSRPSPRLKSVVSTDKPCRTSNRDHVADMETAVASLPNLPTLSIKREYKRCSRDGKLEEKVFEANKMRFAIQEHLGRGKDEVDD